MTTLNPQTWISSGNFTQNGIINQSKLFSGFNEISNADPTSLANNGVNVNTVSNTDTTYITDTTPPNNNNNNTITNVSDGNLQSKSFFLGSNRMETSPTVLPRLTNHNPPGKQSFPDQLQNLTNTLTNTTKSFNYYAHSKHLNNSETMRCNECRLIIFDQYYYSIGDQIWHQSCLRCFECGFLLTEKCYAKDGHLYCREDFVRLVGFEKDILL
ncbi:unnamed protein product [Heterobilharzia americana]|nr:unnamed protein product [Heterobilharzia americana]